MTQNSNFSNFISQLQNITNIDDGLEMLYRVELQCGIYTPVKYSARNFPDFDEEFFGNIHSITDEFLMEGLGDDVETHIRTTLQLFKDESDGDDECNEDDSTAPGPMDERDEDDNTAPGPIDKRDEDDNTAPGPMDDTDASHIVTRKNGVFLTNEEGIEIVEKIAWKFKIFIPLIYTAADFPEFSETFFTQNRYNLFDEMMKDSIVDEIEENIRSTLQTLKEEFSAD